MIPTLSVSILILVHTWIDGRARDAVPVQMSKESIRQAEGLGQPHHDLVERIWETNICKKIQVNLSDIFIMVQYIPLSLK